MSGDNPYRKTIEHLEEIANLLGRGSSAEERAVGADMLDDLGLHATAGICRHKKTAKHAAMHGGLLKAYATAKDKERRASLRMFADSYGIAQNWEIVSYIDATIPLTERGR